MDLSQRFKQHIIDHALFHQKDKLLIAISGGVDSVVLCDLCKKAGYEFSMAHCNFQLREEESDRDEKFVKQLAKDYGAALFIKKFDTANYAKQNKLSIQEAARKLRYEWFNELIANKPDLILTAHHADDSIETALMNFCRGTGLTGLTGIPEKPGSTKLRRPLLIFWKDELLAYAKNNKLDFVEDSSNLSSRYIRNLFRNEIIPMISKAYPQVKENLLNNINRFGEIEKLYRITSGDLKKRLVKQKGNEWHIAARQLLSYNNRALVYEIIADFGFTEKQIDEVIKLATSDSGKYITAPLLNYRIIKHRNWLIITSVNSNESENIIIEKDVSPVFFEKGALHFERTGKQEPVLDNQIACLDAKDISFPLLLRKWKKGDYFYPLGMLKKKKLARFFIDQKLSMTEKENIWVLEMNKKILWVIGHRIDERFKITGNTKEVLKISLHP
jgi:tRNA(Ile)-lysidine synthase